MKIYTKGSEWRKWDLHFHTPSSFDYANKSITNKEIIDTLKENNISAVAITDHHVIDTERIKELKILAGDDITIFPGIELRCELGGSESIHFIAIFDEESDINDIWTKIQGKLNLTPADVEKQGDEKIFCDLKDTCKIIHELNGLVSIHAGSKSNTVENITNALSYKQAIKEEIVAFVDIYEVGKLSDCDGYKKDVFPNINRLLPMIICSDNHNIKDYSLKENLWIKADTTFNGLKQVIYEPESRIFIGNVPDILTKVEINKTKYIKSLHLSKIPDSDLHEEWFNNIELAFNSELIVIIGNKGNGKSALADILGLSGNTKNYQMFSFLNEDKFRNPQNNKSQHFSSTLTWYSSDKDTTTLSKNPELFNTEKIKYIPQHYFEILCGDEVRLFESELKKVIFSHVPDDQKLNKDTLDELITYQASPIHQNIANLKHNLSQINEQIVKLEQAKTDIYKKELQEKIKVKKQELDALEKSKPPQVSKPQEAHLKKSIESLENLTNKNADIEKKIREIDEAKKIVSSKIATINNIIGEIANFKKQYATLQTSIEEQLSLIDLKNYVPINITIDDKLLSENKTKLQNELKDYNSKIDLAVSQSLPNQLKKNLLEIENLKKSLSQPQKNYNEYLIKLNQWQKQKIQIIGTKDDKTSLTYLNTVLDYIETKLDSSLSLLIAKRETVVKDLYEAKSNILNLYKELYMPISKFIDAHKLSSADYPTSFSVTLKHENFESTFFSYVHRGFKGTFYGIEEGMEELKKILDRANFSDERGTLDFLQSIIYHLSFDASNKVSRNLQDQLRKDQLLNFYNYIYSLDYLFPSYELMLGGKSLTKLSAGERGVLLLIFYLLLDKDDCPLILDQPEENLDNESIYELLVPCIREAKSKRQVIIITHNPNLAVVCDAEQIIYAKIDKSAGNKAIYKSGSIENPDMNKKIVDILEGTMPAFITRDKKYTTTKLLLNKN